MTTQTLKQLWPFQAESLNALRENFRQGIRRQVLCSPTGSGKTVIAMHIAALTAAKGNRVWFVCDRQTLVNQTSQRFTENGIDHGVLMGKETRDPWHDVLIASAQTLEARDFGAATANEQRFWDDHDGLEPPTLLIIDECHEIRTKIANWWMNEDIMTIGLSATPFSQHLRNYYQTVVNVTNTNALVPDYLAPLRIVAAEAEVDVDGLSLSSNGEWVRRELSDRVIEISGEIVPEWVKQTSEHFGGPEPTIVFCPSVADCEETARIFNAHGYDFRVIHYRQTADEKKEIIDAFNRGDHIGLISCVALTKGFDAPQTRVLVDAYPQRKSLQMVIQKIGRVMRRSEGKDYGLVIDHAGNWLGFYDQIHAFFASGLRQLPEGKGKGKERASRNDRPKWKCSCGEVFSPESDTCLSCGKAKPIPKPRVGKLAERGNVSMGEIDVVDGNGRKLPFDGDWWVELCAVASHLSPDDDDHARRIALAKYKGIFHEWPKGRFRRVDRAPDRRVAEYSRRQFQRWKIRQRLANR